MGRSVRKELIVVDKLVTLSLNVVISARRFAIHQVSVLSHARLL